MIELCSHLKSQPSLDTLFKPPNTLVSTTVMVLQYQHEETAVPPWWYCSTDNKVSNRYWLLRFSSYKRR